MLVGLPGLHVLDVDIGERVVTVTAEPASAVMGCRTCGVLAVSHGRRDHMLVDAPCFGRPVRVVRRKRTCTCPESLCLVGVCTEQADQVAAPRALLAVRACWLGGRADRREHSSVSGPARQLGCLWPTAWRSRKRDELSARKARRVAVGGLPAEPAGCDVDITNVLSSVLVGATGLGGVWLGHALSARDAERARRDSARDRARSPLSDLIRNASRWAEMKLVLAPGWATFETDNHIAFLDSDSGRDLRQVVDALHSAFGQARLEIGNGPLQEPLKGAHALIVAAPDQMMDPLLDQGVDKTTRVREAWSYLRNSETEVDALESAAADLLSVSLSI